MLNAIKQFSDIIKQANVMYLLEIDPKLKIVNYDLPTLPHHELIYKLFCRLFTPKFSQKIKFKSPVLHVFSKVIKVYSKILHQNFDKANRPT